MMLNKIEERTVFIGVCQIKDVPCPETQPPVKHANVLVDKP